MLNSIPTQTIIPIVIFLVILGIVIFVHELGHFLAARRAGIFVEEFALGMGPKIFGVHGRPRSYAPLDAPGAGDDADGSESQAVWEDRTLYSLRLFPIGGFCRMRGQDEACDEPGAINSKSVGARILVIGGGSLMNFLLAFSLFFLLVMLRGYPVAEVVRLVEGSPGYHAGLMVGDRITHINGSRVTLYDNFMFMLDTSGGRMLDLRVRRERETYNIQLAPAPREGGSGYAIGFYPRNRHGLLHSAPPDSNITLNRVNVLEAFVTSAEMIMFHVRTPFRLLALFVTQSPMPNEARVMGPIGMGGQIVQVYQEVSYFGALDVLLTMMFLTALISAALGIMNLLPIPALDGARLIFLFIEGIRRKPIAPEREGFVHVMGFIVLIALAVFIAYRDIVGML